jgi:S-formylglutathione hydrolase FrmB
VLLACGSGATVTPGARIVHFTIKSRFVHESVRETAVVPAGARHRELLVFLHGRGSSPDDLLWNELFAGLRDLGRRAPIVLLANGGDHSYYHNRRGGKWRSYLMRELIPAALDRLHADPKRVAIGGVSMGGFGALDLARLAPGRFCAVGGHSAALWRTGGETAPGAFDDAEDFAHHDLFRAASRGKPYGRTPVWMDVGTADPFRSADTSFAGLLRSHGARARFHVWPGSHGPTYWRGHIAQYLRFYADACR